jgi:hypothetical protein
MPRKESAHVVVIRTPFTSDKYRRTWPHQVDPAEREDRNYACITPSSNWATHSCLSSSTMEPSPPGSCGGEGLTMRDIPHAQWVGFVMPPTRVSRAGCMASPQKFELWVSSTWSALAELRSFVVLFPCHTAFFECYSRVCLHDQMTRRRTTSMHSQRRMV